MRLLLVLSPNVAGEGRCSDMENKLRLPKYVPQPLHFPPSWVERRQPDGVTHVGTRPRLTVTSCISTQGYNFNWRAAALLLVVICSTSLGLQGRDVRDVCECVNVCVCVGGRASYMLSSLNFVLTHGHVCVPHTNNTTDRTWPFISDFGWLMLETLHPALLHVPYPRVA